MNRRAAQALRLAGGVTLLETVIGVVCYILMRLASFSGASTESVSHRYDLLLKIQNWSVFGTTVLTLVAFALLFSALERRARALAVGALAALALQLALMVFNWLVPARPSLEPPFHFPPMREALWVVQFVA